MPRPISEWTPQELLPIIPPRVLWLWVEGSGAKVSRCRSACIRRWSRTVPGWTRASFLAGVDLEDLVEPLGPVHHDGDVAAAAGQAGAAAPGEERAPCLRQASTVAITSSTSSGITTPMGTWR